MKRRMAAILAADIAGFSRLVAEDEEETLRRLPSYRHVFDDFVVTYGGRIDLSKGPGQSPVYAAPLFETGDERYAWLNLVQAVAMLMIFAAAQGLTRET